MERAGKRVLTLALDNMTDDDHIFGLPQFTSL